MKLERLTARLTKLNNASQDDETLEELIITKMQLNLQIDKGRGQELIG